MYVMAIQVVIWHIRALPLRPDLAWGTMDIPASDLLDMLRQTVLVERITYCAFTVLVWDWLLSIADEVRLTQRCGASIALFAYFVARISIFSLCVLIIIFQNAALPDCKKPFIAMAIATICGTAGNGFLFLLRVRAVYEGSKLITLGFGLWWMAVIGTTFLYSFGVRAEHQPHSSMCMISSAKSWSTASLWVNAVYDTCIFVAISVRIVSFAIHTPPMNAHHHRSNSMSKRTEVEGNWRAFAWGNGLPRVCRELLRGGQLFYFVTIGFTLLGSSMSLAPVTPVLRAGFMAPALAMSTIMTGRVFRGIALAGCPEDCEEERELDDLTAAEMPVFTSVGVVSESESEIRSNRARYAQERERMEPSDARRTNHRRSKCIQEVAIGLDSV
ncbi:hypothetical protein HWV62_31692 [Athelia sp. TMB]|nr:hypothetical protein HWV62_31692 [Athelia sp. TMB]